jgi:hypothetical protein
MTITAAKTRIGSLASDAWNAWAVPWNEPVSEAGAFICASAA